MIYDNCAVGQGVSTQYSIRVRIKNGVSLQGCGGSSTEPIGVAWSYK